MSKYNTIHVVHFKDIDQPNFNPEDMDYCEERGQTYPYTIKYYTVDIDIPSDGLLKFIKFVHSLSLLDQNNNQVLFLLDDRNVGKSLLHRVKEITGLFNDAITKFRNIVEHIREYVENFTFYALLDKSSYYSVSVDFLNERNIAFKKVLNIYISNREKRLVEVVETVYTKRFKKQDTNKLICLEWFMYFSNTAFGCISGRLIQMSGTCYLNAVMNGFILSPVMRNFALTHMKELPNIDLRPLDVDVCEKKDSFYFYRLLYNMICSKISLKDFAYTQDIMIEFSRIYSTADDGEGGRPGWVIRNILNRISHGSSGDLENEVVGDYNFIYIDSTRKPISNVLVYNSNTYHLQFSIIIFGTKNDTHAVVGIICEGQYIVFDSNGYTINLDWTRLLVDKKIKEVFLKFTEEYDSEDKFWLCPVYAKASIVDKYSKIEMDRTCNIIDSNQLSADKHILERAAKLPRKHFVFLKEMLRLKKELPIDFFSDEYSAILNDITNEDILNYAKVLILSDNPTPEQLLEKIKNYGKNILIFFFHITESVKHDSFSLHDNYCKADDKSYPYDILYYTINANISTYGMDQLKFFLRDIYASNTDAKIFFYTNDSKGNSEATLSILEELGDSVEKVTVLINHKYIEYITYYISGKNLRDNNITVKRLVNIVYNDNQTEDAVKIDDKFSDVMSFPGPDNSRDLVCNTWFRYFASQI